MSTEPSDFPFSHAHPSTRDDFDPPESDAAGHWSPSQIVTPAPFIKPSRGRQIQLFFFRHARFESQLRQIKRFIP